ncbi:solute carrier family 22 member 15-like [Elysia marginata]|uniref:Solute carrier family 22 member 15-like n=1 Tax=Elysia marginata TaxID=1093978 RepID=A0AAV4FS70_9GAST|nr:solute carrier family 22 member 15-like [Elysia marginata]
MERKGKVPIATLDNVLQDIGVCGPFQALLVLGLHSCIVSSVWGMMLMAFGSYNPGWVCLDNLSQDDALESKLLSTDFTPNINATEELNTTDRCALYRSCKNVYFSPGTSTVASEWGLVCHRAWTLKAIFTAQMAGVFVGAYLSGQTSEYFGPKATMYGLLALHGVANLVAIFSPSWEVFAAVRFFIGVAAGGMILPAFLTPMEFTGQFWRGVIGSIPVWNTGAALFAVSVIVLKDWRHLHILAAVLSGLSFLHVFWVPQSFRWLAVHGRDKDATAVVTKIAKMNGRPKPSLEILVNMAECERRRALAESSIRYSYLDLFRDSHVRKTVLIMTVVWNTLAIIYYGISFSVQALSGDFYINFLILSMLELPAPIFNLPTMTFLSRRRGSALHFVIVSMACFCITIVSLAYGNDTGEGDPSNDNALKVKIVVSLASIAKIGTVSVWSIMTVYCSELFPTAVRNLGIGYLNSVSRIGGYVGPLLFPHGPAMLYLAMIVLGVLTLVSAGLFLLLPETKGAPLEDVLRSKSLHMTSSRTNFTTKHEDTDTEREVDYFDRGLVEYVDCESTIA